MALLIDNAGRTPYTQEMLEALRRDQADIQRWQKDSFPQDPVLLYRIELRSLDGVSHGPLFALPKQDLPNLDNTVDAVFFDVIQNDIIQEMAFFGMSVWITKVVMCSFEDVRNYPALTVVDPERRAVRASKVFRGLTGIGV